MLSQLLALLNSEFTNGPITILSCSLSPLSLYLAAIVVSRLLDFEPYIKYLSGGYSTLLPRLFDILFVFNS